MLLFLVSIALFLCGGLLALPWGRRPAVASFFGVAGAVAGSLTGLTGFLCAPASAVSQIALPWGLPIGSLVLGLDPASRLFLLPVQLLGAACAVSGLAAMRGHDSHGKAGSHWFFFNLLLAGLSLVMAARDAVTFLLAWELMSLSPFFLISYNDDTAEVREASWIYLVAAHLGAVCVLAFFVSGWAQAGSTSFDALALCAWSGQMATPSLLFVLALAGFGAKAGFMPFHVWLPEAHPAAPSHVSALMSGAMISAGVYGLWRTLELLGPAPLWWGWTLIALGLLSALGGMLQGLAQDNIKRLLAYSSVENMGLACLGLGLGLVGRHSGNVTVAVLGFAGAIFHILNHACFKGLLFLGAGEVLHATGTVRLAELGGLAKRMPVVGACFALAAVGIVGLPPLAGFSGELTLALAMLSGMEGPGLLPRLGMAATLVLMATVGGLALAAFAKAYGLAFSGEPRTPQAEAAHAAPALARLPLLLLATCCLAGAVCAPQLLGLAAQAALNFPGIDPAPARQAMARAGDITALVLVVSLCCAVLTACILLWRRQLLKTSGLRRGPTWGCGYTAPSSRIQYGSASFVDPLVRVFGQATGQKHSLDMDPGYFPAGGRLTVTSPDSLKTLVFVPLFETVARACDALKVVQHGRVHLYILYVLATVVLLLAWKL